MKIAVLADLHDNLTSWQIIAQQLKEKGVEAIFFCGDVAKFSTLQKICQDFSGNVYYVKGNSDLEDSSQQAEKISNLHYFSEIGEIEIDGKQIAFVHSPQQANNLAYSQKYDYVLFGHAHVQVQQQVGKTILLNPGTAGGVFQYPSYAIINLVNKKVKFKRIIL